MAGYCWQVLRWKEKIEGCDARWLKSAKAAGRSTGTGIYAGACTSSWPIDMNTLLFYAAVWPAAVAVGMMIVFMLLVSFRWRRGCTSWGYKRCYGNVQSAAFLPKAIILNRRARNVGNVKIWSGLILKILSHRAINLHRLRLHCQGQQQFISVKNIKKWKHDK